MEFGKVLRMRCSTRGFTSQRVSDEDVKKIVDAAMLAPLAMGDNKTSHLTVVRDPQLMEELRQACMLHKKDGTPHDPFYGATTLIIFSATDVSEDCIEFCNAGCVIENMCLAATDLGLASCYIWGCLKKLKKNPEAVAKLKLPEGYEIFSAFVCGYPVSEITEREVKENFTVDIL